MENAHILLTKTTIICLENVFWYNILFSADQRNFAMDIQLLLSNKSVK